MKLSELKSEILLIMDSDDFNPDDIVSKITRYKIKNGCLSLPDVQKCASEACNVTIDQMKSGTHKREVVISRWLVYDYGFHILGIPKQTLGRAFNQDHATVISALKKLKQDLEMRYPDTVGYKETFNLLIKNRQDEHKNALATIAK